MENNHQFSQFSLPDGYILAPIHQVDEVATPLVICVLVHRNDAHDGNAFILLRVLPGEQIFLGAICDAEARIQEWVEISVQAAQIRELAFSGYQEQLSNLFFDRRWQADGKLLRNQLPEAVIATKMEVKSPGPVLIKRSLPANVSGFATVEITGWRVCVDDALLQSFGLESYTGSPYRYLHQPDVKETKTFLATTSDTPANSHVQSIDRLKSTPDIHAVFNPGGGLIRVIRHNPLELESHLQILEGKAWNENNSPMCFYPPGSQYAALQAWSSKPHGLPFLLHGKGNMGERLNEIFLLKLSLLHEILKKVRASVKACQFPLLNLSPASFRVSIKETGDQFPLLWSAECKLIKPSQAYSLKIKSTEQKYFIRLGRIEPSPFLPEGMGAHSFGIGSVQVRNVTTTADGVSLEGTLVGEDYLSIDANDLLWFKLPLTENRPEFYAHVYKSDAASHREVRFRTVPAKLSESAITTLKQSAGIRFPKSPYEIWPLLSSPCDLFSIGVMGVRILLANSQSNLPVVLDEILSLARRINESGPNNEDCLKELKALLQKDAVISELISPRALVETAFTSKQAWAAVHAEIWQETVGLLLRFFPDTGPNAFCKNFGDVSPLALETVFDLPMQGVELLVLRLRSLLSPTFSTNQEIAAVILEQMA
jgi:hypothetical protein